MLSDSLDLGFDPERFFLGSVCRRQHRWNGLNNSLRYIAKHECVECKKLLCKRWRSENPEKVKAGRTKYNQQDRVKEYKRQHWIKNADCYKQEKRDRYQQNKAEHLSKTREYYLAHREQTLQYYKEYRNQNREHLANQSRLYYETHKDRLNALAKQYRDGNKEEVRAQRRKYRQSNRHKVLKAAAHHRRKVRLNSSHAAPYTPNDLIEHLSQFEEKCVYCDRSFNQSIFDRRRTIDHFLPVALGGADCLNNMVAACQSRNSSKQHKDPRDWFLSQAFGSKKKWNALVKRLGKMPD